MADQGKTVRTNRAAEQIARLSKNRLDWDDERMARQRPTQWDGERGAQADLGDEHLDELLDEDEEDFDAGLGLDPEDGDQDEHDDEDMADGPMAPRAQPLPQRVPTEEEKQKAADAIDALAVKNAKTPEERAADANELMRRMASGELQKEKANVAVAKMQAYLRERPEIERITKAKAAELADKFAAERPKIESQRLVRAKTVMSGHIVKRTRKAGVLSQGLAGKLVKKREFLNDHKVTKEQEYQTVYKSPNVHIVYYPPQYRTIQTARHKYRLPFPYVVFVHVQYNDAHYYRQRRAADRGRVGGRQGINRWHNSLYIGFTSTQPDPENLRACMVSAPPMPHVYQEGTICMGTIYKDGKPIRADHLNGETNGLTIDDLIDTFWNNRFVYDQTNRRLRYTRWQNMTPEEMVAIDWSDQEHRAYRLDRFPPEMKKLRDYFIEDGAVGEEGNAQVVR